MGLIVHDSITFGFSSNPITDSYWNVFGNVILSKQPAGNYRVSFCFSAYYNYDMRDRLSIEQRMVEFDLTTPQLVDLFPLAYSELKKQFINYSDVN